MDSKPSDKMDQYTASIDFSNACREFYINRVRATENFKEQMREDCGKLEPSQERKRSSIDRAMETLRREMASLMDQDLCLMKQLLTLNETIEDIKTKRMYQTSENSLHASSGNLSGSDDSLSETDMYAPDEGQENEKFTICPSTNIYSDSDSLCEKQTKLESNSRFIDTHILLNGKPLHVVHGVQSSVDSGYDESDDHAYQKDIEVTL